MQIQPDEINENGRLSQQPDSRARVLIGFSVINIITWLLSTTFSVCILSISIYISNLMIFIYLNPGNALDSIQ